MRPAATGAEEVDSDTEWLRELFAHPPPDPGECEWFEDLLGNRLATPAASAQAPSSSGLAAPGWDVARLDGSRSEAESAPSSSALPAAEAERPQKQSQPCRRVPGWDVARLDSSSSEAESAPTCQRALLGLPRLMLCRDPPDIVAIREERLRREAVESKQNAERQREAWRCASRRCSPDSRGKSVKERCSERSLSPLVLERLARQETADLPAVRWEKHLDWIDPRAESIACSARQAILGAPSFYVGVTRYPRRRWLGGDHLTFEESHSSRWETMHVLSTHSHRVGDAEDALIRILRKENGERCTNIRGGGGGASPYKTNLLYVCVP